VNLLLQLTPSNAAAEKRKFFGDKSYNPQLTYEHPASLQQMSKHPKPDLETLAIATRIANAGSPKNQDPRNNDNDKLLTQKEVTAKAKIFLRMHGLAERYAVVWSASYISRATMTKKALKLKSIASFRERETAGLLFHEIGTHAIRQVNYEQQPWHRRKKKYGFSSYIETEEGLASLHSLLPVPNKLLYKPAVRYMAVHYSQTLSFAELWQFLTPYITDEEERWMVCIRQKRGLKDTTQPCIFMKDATYFSGALKIARWLSENNFDISKLYYGKLAIEDVDKAVELNPKFVPKLPSFFTTSREAYKNNIQEIIAQNKLFV